MCGLAGFVTRARAPELLSPMVARLRHRGPDASGEHVSSRGGWHVHLGHRRLAIIDREGGAQPMRTPDGDSVLVYNGELYNFRELRGELSARGVAFATRSDSEVLLRWCEARGSDGLGALSGMFAFALWDARRGRLLLARDRVGIKPLYYATLDDGGLAFASELTSLLQHRDVRRTVCPDALLSYFFSDYAHAPLAMIRGVRKLEPGSFVEWRDGALSTPHAFWNVAEIEERRQAPRERDVARELWDRIDAAVARQLVADVPVGVFLSGGLDSSIVATLARRSYGPSLTTFSIGFDEPTFDESGAARDLARALETRHVEERLGERTMLDLVDAALSSLDEPLADPSYLPTYLVSRLAAAHGKVVLSGDGGDELFGGYPTYRAHRLSPIFGALPPAMRAGLVPALVARLREGDGYQDLAWKLKRFVLRWDEVDAMRHLRWMSSLDLDELRAAVGVGGVPATADAPLPPWTDRLNRVLALDFTTYLPGSVLTKVDRASMAHGLEVRPPLLDDEIVEYAFRLPSRLKVDGMRTKIVLRHAARPHVPRSVLDRPKKGFGIPLAKWLRGPLRDRLRAALADGPIWEGGLLRRSAFADLAAAHDARRADHSKPLWALVALDHWAKRERVAFEQPRGEREPSKERILA